MTDLIPALPSLYLLGRLSMKRESSLNSLTSFFGKVSLSLFFDISPLVYVLSLEGFWVYVCVWTHSDRRQRRRWSVTHSGPCVAVELQDFQGFHSWVCRSETVVPSVFSYPGRASPTCLSSPLAMALSTSLWSSSQIPWLGNLLRVLWPSSLTRPFPYPLSPSGLWFLLRP